MKFGKFGLALLAFAAPSSLAWAQTAAPPAASAPDQGVNAQVRFGPAPAWVVPVTASAKAGEGGVVIRLVDNQLRADETGLHSYDRKVLRFNSAAALQQATNLLVRWQPEHGGATVHTARILRAGKVIDLLAGNATFQVIRQEAGLEAGKVDGMLTAYLPISDLRVGDELDFSFTIDQRNPALGGHFEYQYVLNPESHLDQLNMRLSYPRSTAPRLRTGQYWPKPRQSQDGAWTVQTLTALDLTTPKFPASAPTRLFDRHLIQFTDFASWEEVAAVMRPLYEQAASLPENSPIKAEIARLAAAHADPLARASAALTLVQHDVRYFAELQGLGGYTPVHADTVWAKRIGDCKGKTVLLLALLRGLGIEAQPVLVSTRMGDGMDQVIPQPGRFDHVIVRATIAGKPYWLDGTRIDNSGITDLEIPDFLWSLPLEAGTKSLAALPVTPYKRAQNDWRLDLDASAGLGEPAKATGTGVLRGDMAMAFAQMFQVVDPAKADETLRAFWKARHDWVEIDKVSHSIDNEHGEVRIGFTGTGKMDWNDTGPSPAYRYEANKARIGTTLLGDDEPLRGADQPVLVDRRHDITRQTIILPDGGKGFTIEGSSFDETIGGIHYSRQAKLSGNRFDMETVTSSPRLELSPQDAKLADEKATALFNRQLFIRMPGHEADPSALNDEVNALLSATEALVAKGERAAAEQQLDAYLAQHPRDPNVLAARAALANDAGKPDEADRLLDLALAIDGKSRAALFGKAQSLAVRARFEDALLVADRAILHHPDDFGFYEMRSRLRQEAGQKEGAVSDLEIAQIKAPEQLKAWLGFSKARLLSQQGQLDAAIAELRQLLKTSAVPNQIDALNLMANLQAIKGNKAEALQLVGKSLAIQDNADARVVRMNFGLGGTNPDRLTADAVALVTSDPTRAIPWTALRTIAASPARLQRVLTAYDAWAANPKANQREIAVQRGRVQLAGGQSDAYQKALTAIETAEPKNAEVRNRACWDLATHKIGLDQARKSCEAAIAIVRSPAYVDSLGMLELQSGRIEQALAAYSEAAAKLPGSAPTAFGHGLALLRAGRKDEGQAELARARTLNPRIDEEFADYGLKP